MNLRPAGALLGLLALLLPVGCATRIDGKKVVFEAVVTGDVAVAGEANDVHLLAGSDVPKLSIMGEDNRIRVADGATVRKIEIVGEDNVLTLPAELACPISQMGEGNRVERR